MASQFSWADVVDYSRRQEVETPKTQYELPGLTAEYHRGGVPVIVPPLWHIVVTARLAFPPDDQHTLRQAQKRLEAALTSVEGVYPLQPHGLFIQVAYGLPYFHERIPAPITVRCMPRSAMAGTAGQWAVIDSIRFPKDPGDLILERNDMAFHFLSDYRDHVESVLDALFTPGEHLLNGIPARSAYLGDLLTVTTMRRGFVGRNMPKLMGLRHGIPGAEQIPDGAMLFMGFTSTGADTVAMGNTPSFETIPGFTDQTPNSYFAHGAAMHLSRTAIDIERWYAHSPKERLQRMYHARIEGSPTDLTHFSAPLPAPPRRFFSFDHMGSVEEVMDQIREYDAEQLGVLGHAMQMHDLDRIFEGRTSAHGERLQAGAVYFLREDFNTVENPFSYSIDDEISPTPQAGLHFIGFGPSSQHFEQMRLKMDSVDLQRRHGLPDESIGLAKFLTTTHRQNFLLPPRAHRAMPLAEFLQGA
jgi:hypothetical protein